MTSNLIPSVPSEPTEIVPWLHLTSLVLHVSQRNEYAAGSAWLNWLAVHSQKGQVLGLIPREEGLLLHLSVGCMTNALCVRRLVS